MEELPFEERLFEVNGNIWDYEKIATVSASIAKEFLERLDISVLERLVLLQRFVKGILDINEGIDRSVELIGRKKLFDIVFHERVGNPYEFNEIVNIVDYLGVEIPKDFEFDNYVSLGFSQRAYRDKFIKDTPIPKMQAEEVMQFVEGVCKKHEGISPLYGPNDFPEKMQQDLQYGIISTIDFDKDTYMIGKGIIKIRLLKEGDPFFL